MRQDTSKSGVELAHIVIVIRTNEYVLCDVMYKSIQHAHTTMPANMYVCIVSYLCLLYSIRVALTYCA